MRIIRAERKNIYRMFLSCHTVWTQQPFHPAVSGDCAIHLIRPGSTKQTPSFLHFWTQHGHGAAVAWSKHTESQAWTTVHFSHLHLTPLPPSEYNLTPSALCNISECSFGIITLTLNRLFTMWNTFVSNT